MNSSLLLKISITIVLFTINDIVLETLGNLKKLPEEISNETLQDSDENQNILGESSEFKILQDKILNETQKYIDKNQQTLGQSNGSTKLLEDILNQTPKNISEIHKISRELNETRELSEETKNGNLTDIHKYYPNIYCSSDIILEDSIELISHHYTSDENPGYIWRIIVPEDDHQILVQFHYVVTVNNSQKNCEKNYIEIRNGLSSSAPLIQRVCDDFPYNIYSKGRELYIKLVNHEVNSSLEFSTYITNVLDVCHYFNRKCEHHCINTFHGYICLCDEGFYLDSEGTKCISSYEEYGTINHEMCENHSIFDDYHCEWKIMAPPNYRIALNFTHFNFEQKYSDCNNCSRNSHIKIIETLEDDGIKIELHCGTQLPSIILSKSNQIGIELKTNENTLNSKFAVDYHIVKDECAFNNGGCPDQCRKTIDSFKCFSCIDFGALNDYE